MTSAQVEQFKEHHREYLQEQKKIINITTLDQLITYYEKYLYLEETEDIDILLAALLDREIPGDPVWIQNIAPSGDKKTEIIRSFKDYHRAYTLDSLTPKTLISGMTRKNKETGDPEPAAGLLFKINNKVLIIKDFTTILGKSDETRTEIYSQLRGIYDGYFEGAYGTLPDKVELPSRIGLIACATPAIDRYNRLENALGTRFLKIRSDSDPIKAATKAIQNMGKSDSVRERLKQAVKQFIDSLNKHGAFNPENIPRVTESQKNQIIQLAQYIALMRATVWGKWDHTGDLVYLEALNQEKPTRAAKQLMKLGQLLAVIRGHGELTREDMNTLRRVAKDTAEPTRQTIIDCFHRHGEFKAKLTPQDIEGISRSIGKRLHYKTARNELEVMETLEILDRNKEGEYYINKEFMRTLQHTHPPATSEKNRYFSSFSEVTKGESVDNNSDRSPQVNQLLEKALNYVGAGFTTPEEVRQQLEIKAEGVRRLLDTLERDGRIYQRPPGEYHAAKENSND